MIVLNKIKKLKIYKRIFSRAAVNINWTYPRFVYTDIYVLCFCLHRKVSFSWTFAHAHIHGIYVKMFDRTVNEIKSSSYASVLISQFTHRISWTRTCTQTVVISFFVYSYVNKCKKKNQWFSLFIFVWMPTTAIFWIFFCVFI